VDVSLTGLGVRIQHEAMCPEVDPLLCATTDIPMHMHDQRITWFRLSPGLTVGLGEGWQASLELPVDVRQVRVDYTTMDGAPFDPPYDDIHHRDEVLYGPVDGSLWVRRYFSAGRFLYGAGLGSTLPLGRTEEDPYALTEEGLTHQHLQLGAGAFIPQIGLDLLYSQGRWGMMSAISGRVPLYANGKGYLAPLSLNLSAGPTFRSSKTLMWALSAEGLYEGAESWGGTPSGGKTALGAALGAFWTLSPQVTLQAQARTTLYQHDAPSDEDGQIRQWLIGTVGLSWQGAGKGEGKEPGEEP